VHQITKVLTGSKCCSFECIPYLHWHWFLQNPICSRNYYAVLYTYS